MMDSLKFIVALLWAVLGFAGYYFSGHKKSATGTVREVMAQRGWGVLFLGVVSMGIIFLFWRESPVPFGFGFSFRFPPPWWSYLAVPVIIVVSYFHSFSPANLAVYPQIRTEKWNGRILVLSAVSWIVFLVAYEFFFRGFLLFASLAAMDPWPAIALNCTLYGFAHLYKGPGETFGAILVGVLLCHLTIHTGNIWSAVAIHTAMALSNEWFSLRAHPDMELVRI